MRKAITILAALCAILLGSGRVLTGAVQRLSPRRGLALSAIAVLVTVTAPSLDAAEVWRRTVIGAESSTLEPQRCLTWNRYWRLSVPIEGETAEWRKYNRLHELAESLHAEFLLESLTVGQRIGYGIDPGGANPSGVQHLHRLDHDRWELADGATKRRHDSSGKLSYVFDIFLLDWKRTNTPRGWPSHGTLYSQGGMTAWAQIKAPIKNRAQSGSRWEWEAHRIDLSEMIRKYYRSRSVRAFSRWSNIELGFIAKADTGNATKETIRLPLDQAFDDAVYGLLECAIGANAWPRGFTNARDVRTQSMTGSWWSE